MPVVLIMFMNVCRMLASFCSAQPLGFLFCCESYNSFFVSSLVSCIALCMYSPTLSQGLAGTSPNNLTFGGPALLTSLFSAALPHILQPFNLPQTLISASTVQSNYSDLLGPQPFALKSGNCPQVERWSSHESYLVRFQYFKVHSWAWLAHNCLREED